MLRRGFERKNSTVQTKIQLFEDKGLYWEMLKIEIRSFTIYYCRQNANENRTLTSPDEILNEEHRYYKRLHTSSRTNPNDPRFEVFFDSPTLPKPSPPQADSCDGLLTKEECYVSLKSFSKGKSPGTDGLTAEFYFSFWELLEQELVDSFNYAFEKGEITISQKRGFITLIPKQDKNRTLLDNWTPISLLNTDYKVATKSIAARIAKVLPSLIHKDQTVYFKGCFIGQNIRFIANIREHDDNLVEDDRKRDTVYCASAASKFRRRGLVDDAKHSSVTSSPFTSFGRYKSTVFKRFFEVFFAFFWSS